MVSCQDSSKKNPYQGNLLWNYSDLKQDLEAGDIILKHGHGTISRFISKTLAEEIPLSHCAIVSEIFNDSIVLIHSISGKLTIKDGVQKIRLNAFMKDVVKGSFIVLRHKSELTQRKKMGEFALRLEGQSIGFDLKFNNHDRSKLYCTEMIAEVLTKIYGEPFFDIKQIGNGEVYSFNSLLKSPHFYQLSQDGNRVD